jgi:hypothetical protein
MVSCKCSSCCCLPFYNYGSSVLLRVYCFFFSFFETPFTVYGEGIWASCPAKGEALEFIDG